MSIKEILYHIATGAGLLFLCYLWVVIIFVIGGAE